MYAHFAVPTHKDLDNSIIFDLVSSYLNGSSNRIHYGGDATKSFMATTQTNDLDTSAMSFHKAYSDQGLFGFALAGYSGKSIGQRLQNIIQQLRHFSASPEGLERAK